MIINDHFQNFKVYQNCKNFKQSVERFKNNKMQKTIFNAIQD